MTDQLYVKRGNRYQPIGREFTGFPADGIWLVADGRQSCLIKLCDVGHLPPITALRDQALNDHDKRLTAAGRSTTEMTEDTNSPNSPLDLLVRCKNYEVKMNYLDHLKVNFKVAGRCLLLMILHAAHGLIPVKWTSHEFWGI